ncbi:MAG: DNA primase [Gaiellaceae bacterium]
MARIKDSSVEAVKQTASIVDVISLRTPLRKVGGRYTGRCPFHEERAPSFSVNAEKGVYYCFGCGASGDTISFVRETEQLDFVGAVEFLAERFNVPLEYDESSPQADADRKRRDRLYALLEQATSFYERYLWDSEAGASAREYLAGRGLGEEACREFRLGLAPLAPALARKAQEKGFTGAELAAAGLVGRRGSDYFSGRLLFPLADARGRVVGFQARKLRDDDPLKAKYVNTPEGELFHKGAILYGLDRSRAAIAKEDRALVVEGNTDVIALRQAGLGPVVASMGTALTERQLKELGRLTRTLCLCFDGDAAGEAATLRGMELAASQGFDVKVVALPPGLDPADAPDAFEAKLAEAEPYLGYRVRIEVERALPNRQEAFVRAREILERFDDSPDFQDALRYLADRLDLPKETQAGLAPRRRSRGGAAETVSPRLLEAGERLERDALAGCIAHPGLVRILAELGPEHFDSEDVRRLREHLVARTPPPDDLVALYAELDARAASSGIDEETAEQLLLRLRERRLERELQTADVEHLRDLQIALQKVRTAFREFA